MTYFMSGPLVAHTPFNISELISTLTTPNSTSFPLRRGLRLHCINNSLLLFITKLFGGLRLGKKTEYDRAKVKKGRRHLWTGLDSPSCGAIYISSAIFKSTATLTTRHPTTIQIRGTVRVSSLIKSTVH